MKKLKALAAVNFFRFPFRVCFSLGTLDCFEIFASFCLAGEMSEETQTKYFTLAFTFTLVFVINCFAGAKERM